MGHSTGEEKAVVISNATGWATGILLILFVVGLINFTKAEDSSHDAHATQVQTDHHATEGTPKAEKPAHH